MTAHMYILLILMFIFANLPFMTQRGLGWIRLAKKTIWHHLAELLLGWWIVAGLAYLLESRAGTVHHQNWQFYVVVVCLYLVAAFPAFVWRYFWHSRHQQ